MNRKVLFAFIKGQLPMLPHIHAELDALDAYVTKLEAEQKPVDAVAKIPVPAIVIPTKA